MRYKKNRRLRCFGGPNGSGKSTIFNELEKQFDFGLYVNADEIEKELLQKSFIDLSKFGISNFSESDFLNFIVNHSLIKKASEKGHLISLSINHHKIITSQNLKLSYEAALIADLIRHFAILNGHKLTFETVMSHNSKIAVFDYASTNFYKNYLYFVCTESPEINVERVKQRALLNGHNVEEKVIIDRYYKSLSNLKEAVSKTYRAFIWDNSGKKPILIMEILEGKKVTILHNKIPNWVNEYLLK